MRRRRKGLFTTVPVAAIFVVALAATSAPAADKMLPVPTVTIRPGQPIRDDAITERAFAPNYLANARLIESKAQLTGQIARRTLLPGQPIAVNAVDPPGTVTRGVPVRLVVEDGGLVIIAYATPLQNASVGALVRVRNLDTGVIVTGVVQPDGTVRAGNG
jgi:flagella basal body P-ring formation protein FlgA